jgi:hypothetical protein
LKSPTAGWSSRLDRSDRLWAFRGELTVPLDHVSGVEVDPEPARIPWSGGPTGWVSRAFEPAVRRR